MSAETTNDRVRECLKPGKLAIAEAIANEYQRAKDEAIRELLAGALRNVPDIEKQVENFSCQRSSDKNPLSLSPQLTRNFGVAICIYQDHLCIGLTSPDGEVSTKQRKSLREKAESEYRNGYNATRLDEASECWPVSVSSQEAISGSFLDADRKKEELKDEICRWYKFLTSSGVKEVFR